MRENVYFRAQIIKMCAQTQFPPMFFAKRKNKGNFHARFPKTMRTSSIFSHTFKKT